MLHTNTHHIDRDSVGLGFVDDLQVITHIGHIVVVNQAAAANHHDIGLFYSVAAMLRVDSYLAIRHVGL